ncbi:AI-2E family transporter [Neolewinella persica]|uniref:AI-2E family transporter n=1 Tax=Neolewinella persica TaxID=70998 RepID=UPI0003808855|nr:AI-2E family transporter [Neolewinella persica]
MSANTLSIHKLTSALICLCIAISMLYIGSSFFIPLTYGIFFAFMLKPICDRFERVVKNRVLAIILTLLSVGLLIGMIIYFFFFQISQVLGEAGNIVAKLEEASNAVMAYFGELLGYTTRETSAIIEEEVTSAINKPFGMLTVGLSTSGILLANFALVVIYIFFFLLYSTAVRRFVQGQFSDSAKKEGEETLREIQHVAANYLGGMLTVMLVLGVLNSLGLYLIGIKYALVWGFLGALLAVVPYVGTTVGGLLPFMYAIATTDTVWQPTAVVILYVTVQFVEGNLITPKVVGNSVKINALAAVVSIILGALIWGIPGVILSIPLLAMFRIILDHIPSFKPVALLLSDELYAESNRYLNEYNHPQYRLSSLFQKRKQRQIVTSKNAAPPSDEVTKADAKVISDPKTK